jgi:hypothetical protein
MAVDNPRTIDIVSTVRATGDVVLVVADHLPWDDVHHLDALQTKLNNYLAYIESGQLAAAYTVADGARVRIEVVCLHAPSAEGEAFFAAVERVIVAAGFGFSWVHAPNPTNGE